MSYLGELRENDGRLVLKAFISPSKDVRAFILLVKLLQKLIPSNVVPSTWHFHEGMKEGSDVSLSILIASEAALYAQDQLRGLSYLCRCCSETTNNVLCSPFSGTASN